ncbi:Acetyltransferase (GNAT) family protein [Clostridium liquoris]|jgi:predicted GNAT superfamily acetyltransferase|uniref:Acetyltransferase (GNAT) family protein n=1 Tax=Clostridium liquoris TaxID=1289519 RepID=A0A2T0B283_9CLOT|nr:GNAT family N-acetyltransferase [Clostridium liquoris]PRR78010.1 Acetyltransferase (GNAT) family protein [Clostridium liquoris]
MLIIEKAKKEDAKSIHDISRELNISYVKDKDRGVLLRIISEEYIEQNINNFIVARLYGSIAGFLWFNTQYPDELLDDTVLQGNIDNCIYSEQIAVKREYEGLGIGRKLYKFIKENSPDKGILVFVNTAPEGNKASFSFHTSIGFKTVGIFHRKYFCGFEDFTSKLLRL